MDNETWEAMQKATILDMRIIGRMIGVPSPSKLSRTDLLKWIIAIAEGKVRPAEPSKKGQPVKRISLAPEHQRLADKLQKLGRENYAKLHGANDADGEKMYDGTIPAVPDVTFPAFFFTDSNGGCGARDEDFKLLTPLGVIRDIADGASIDVRTDDNAVMAVESVLTKYYVMPAPWRECRTENGRTLRLGGFPVREGGVTVIRGEGATTAASAIAEQLQADQIRVVDFGGGMPEGWDVTRECVHVGSASKEESDYIRFAAARAMRCAEYGERYLLVASGFIPLEWASACGTLQNGGSVTLLALTDEEAKADSVIETEGLSDVFPPIDLTRSSSAYYGADERYLELKSSAKGKSPLDAWRAAFLRSANPI